MKTIKYIALGVLATSMTLANTSCSDSFLEVENPSGENLEEYFKFCCKIITFIRNEQIVSKKKTDIRSKRK
jgi:hypothetical protein